MWCLIIILCFIGPSTTMPSSYNFLLILTDDQDLLLDGMKPMTKTIKWIANEGCVFSKAFVNTPICCPSRSTLLTGKYLHNTGVRNNSIEGNCSSRKWQEEQEQNTIATYLKRLGNYTTFYAGKYLNQYGTKIAGGVEHVPPGYDWWIGLKGNSKYYNYSLSINGTEHKFTDEYLTDVLKEYSVQFLNNWNKEKPFFMMVAPPASHAPFTPAPRHAAAFPGAKALQTPNFNRGFHEKHWLVNMHPTPLTEPFTILDKIQRGRLQTLLAVDELVDELMLTLQRMNVLENTVVIFTSDNGYHLGQFGLPWDKRQPYETDINVPFLMRAPHIPKKRVINIPISTVDLAPSILTYAGLPVPEDMDGKSFIVKLSDQKHVVKDYEDARIILIEYYGEYGTKSVDATCPWKYDRNLTECSVDSWCKCQDSRNNTYACLIDISDTKHLKFCVFADDKEFVEVYSIRFDPYELNNIYTLIPFDQVLKYKNILDELTKCVGRNCIL